MRLPRIDDIPSLLFRALVLAVLAVPAFTNWPMRNIAAEGSLGSIGLWAVYCLVVQLVIVHNTSGPEWQRLFGVASLVAVFTAITGAVVEFVANGNYLQAAQSVLGVRYLGQAILMLTVIPYGLFVARCFPIADFCVRSGNRRGRLSSRRKLTILTIRTLNHLSEVVASIAPLWREQMPSLYVPRSVEARQAGFYIPTPLFLERVYIALHVLCLSLLVAALEAMPAIVEEIDAL